MKLPRSATNIPIQIEVFRIELPYPAGFINREELATTEYRRSDDYQPLYQEMGKVQTDRHHPTRPKPKMPSADNKFIQIAIASASSLMA